MTRCSDCKNYVTEGKEFGRCFGQPVKGSMSSRNCPRENFCPR